jgi:hypothetical protein
MHLFHPSPPATQAMFWSYLSSVYSYLTLSSETETTFHYYWRVKSSFKQVWMEATLPMQQTD